MVRSIKHRRLKRLYERGDTSGFAAHDVERLRYILALLDEAERPDQMDIAGFHFHRLRGDRKDTYAVTVRANYRVTWRVDKDDAFIDVTYEDYH